MQTYPYRYSTYGLQIGSAYRLAWSQSSSQFRAVKPDLLLAPGRKADFSKALEALGKTPGPIPWFQYKSLADGSDYLRWPRLFEFLLSADGRFIYGHQLRKLSLETLQTYLMGQLISFALLKRGIESLHATATVFGNEAVGFLGDCGMGKSTLAAACVRAGYPLLTDDLLRLNNRSGRLLAYPGPARIKLMPKTAKYLMGPSIKSAPINPLTTKQSIPLNGGQSVQRKVPLRALYLLKLPQKNARPKISIRALSKREAWQALSANTFNISVYEPKRHRTHFLWASGLAGQITVKALAYPRSLLLLPEVINAIQEDLHNADCPGN